MLEKQESVVILMLDTWSIVEDTNIRVVHLIVTNKHKGGNVNSFVTVWSCAGCGLADRLECVVNLANEFFMVDITSTNNYKVVTEVVSSVVTSKVVNCKVAKVISITFDWLS